MKQMLDVLFLVDTGHVLGAVVRAGEAVGPLADVLAGDDLFYPLVPPDKQPVLEIPIPTDVALERISVALTDDKARVLFQRASYQVDGGALVSGLADVTLSRASADAITVAIPAAATATPFIVIGKRVGGGAPKLHTGEIPQATPSVQVTEFSTAQYSTVAVFVKGFAPKAI